MQFKMSIAVYNPPITDLWSTVIQTAATLMGGFSWFIALLTGKKKEKKKARRKPIPKRVREEVWTKYHGRRKYGCCYACGKRIHTDSWHCSHVVAYAHGGPDTIENLRTCCVKCNLSMKTTNMYVFIENRQLRGPGAQR